MASMSMNISDYVISVLSVQSLQPSVISHSLTLIVILLGAVLLHDALARSKHLSASWLLSHDVVSAASPPPGPWLKLPLLGYLPWLDGRKPYVTLWNLSRRYGNVFQVRFGSRAVVVLNGRETIKEAFVRQGDTFAGRPDFPSWAVFCEGRSLTFNSINDDWITQHKTVLRALGLFTQNAKHSTETLIHRQAVGLAERLVHDSTPPPGNDHSTPMAPAAVEPYDAIESAVVGVMFEMCFGAPGAGDDALYAQMMEMLHAMRSVMPAVQSVDIMPWLAPLLRAPLRHYTDSLLHSHLLTTRKTTSIINAGVPDQPTCAVHALHQAGKSEHADDSLRARIMATVDDFIGAGSEIVVHFLHWAILYAAKYPDAVQQRVRDEIRRTVGWTAAPVAADRARMPYTDACLWEIMRHACVTPMTLPHAAVSDAVIAGHSVPAGTIVFANLYSTGWDPEIWDDPDAFRPERFLTPGGHQLDRQALGQFMCFGAGRRRCPGAQFGTMEMFIFFVVLMQRCAFSAAPGHELSTDDANFVLTNQAKRYHVLVQPAAHDDDKAI